MSSVQSSCEIHQDADTPRVTVNVEESRPEGYDGSCLRPLGLCELGGSCDACWYSPDHPRFAE
jgi:hypothetical protein